MATLSWCFTAHSCYYIFWTRTGKVITFTHGKQLLQLYAARFFICFLICPPYRTEQKGTPKKSKTYTKFLMFHGI